MVGEYVDQLSCVSKREDEDMRRFGFFLLSTGYNRVIVYDKPDVTRGVRSLKRNCDFFVELGSDEKLALEFSQILEEEKEIKGRIQWANLVHAFRDELSRSEQKRGGPRWNGLWNVLTPVTFAATLNKSTSIAHRNVDRLVGAIEEGEPSAQIEGFVLKLIKVADSTSGELFFSTDPFGGEVHPPEVIKSFLEKKLRIANLQLDVDEQKTRILVIVNRYTFGRTEEVVEALSQIAEIWDYENIDKIFLEERTGRFILVWSRDLRDAWKQDKISLSDTFIQPFQLWIPHLRIKDPEKTLRFVKGILGKCSKKPHEMFPINSTRVEIVNLSDWLTEKEKFEELAWVVETFLDDPDPREPEVGAGVSGLDYHRRILEGQDLPIVDTVLGNLAWAIRGLALSKQCINSALRYTKRLASHENLYVKKQALIPLSLIAANRKWLEGYGERPRRGAYEEFHRLAFDMVRLVRDNPNCVAIANGLCPVFRMYRDLSTEEAEQVLDALKITWESAPLFVYFAVFRERDFRDQSVDFESSRLGKKLADMIVIESEMYNRLRAGIAWQLAEVLAHDRSEFDAVRSYVDLLLEQRCWGVLCFHVVRIIELCIRCSPEVYIPWFKQMLSKILKEEQREVSDARLGFLLSENTSIIEAIAELSPIDLNVTMEYLKKLRYSGRNDEKMKHE